MSPAYEWGDQISFSNPILGRFLGFCLGSGIIGLVAKLKIFLYFAYICVYDDGCIYVCIYSFIYSCMYMSPYICICGVLSYRPKVHYPYRLIAFFFVFLSSFVSLHSQNKKGLAFLPASRGYWVRYLVRWLCFFL